MSVDVKKEFYDFGTKMKIVAILTILQIIPWVGSILSFVAYIILWQSLTDITNANLKLGDGTLETYRSKYSTVLILRFINAFVTIGGWFFPASSIDIYTLQVYFNPIGLTLSGIGWIIALIAGIIEMGAWQSLNDFFMQSSGKFPGHIQTEAADGARNLKTAALMYVLSFLIITILIGWIMQIIGFFKLAKLEQVTYTGQPAVVSTPAPTSASAPQPVVPGKSFCPNCGADVKGAGKFCGECGSEI